MRRSLQRVRGAAGVGVSWGAAWAPVGAVVGWLAALALDFPPGRVAWNYAVMFAVLGVVGGALFSAVLRLADGRRTFDELSLPRFAAWGALGGLALGALAVAVGLLGAGLTALGAAIVLASTLLAAGSAAGTLAVARSAQSRPLLPPGDDAPGLARRAPHALGTRP